MSPSLAFLGQLMSTEGAPFWLIAGSTLKLGSTIQPLRAHGLLARGPGSQAAARDGTPLLGAWPALTLSILPPWPWETTLSIRFPTVKLRDHLQHTHRRGRINAARLARHRDLCAVHCAPATGRPSASYVRTHAAREDPVGYPGPAERTREAGQVAEAAPIKQVPHLHRSRDSTHPGAEAPPRAARQSNRLSAPPANPAHTRYYYRRTAPRLLRSRPCCLQAALVRDELVAAPLVPLLCEPCAVDGLASTKSDESRPHRTALWWDTQTTPLRARRAICGQLRIPASSSTCQ